MWPLPGNGNFDVFCTAARGRNDNMPHYMQQGKYILLNMKNCDIRYIKQQLFRFVPIGKTPLS